MRVDFNKYNCFCFHFVNQESKDGSLTALIWGASPQTRSDRRKDRVETNPEQLAAASAQADISFHVSSSYFWGLLLHVRLIVCFFNILL